MSLTNQSLGLTTDWCSEAGAKQIAEHIREYWASRGQSVRIEIATVSMRKDSGTIYCIRSDMIRGWPQ